MNRRDAGTSAEIYGIFQNQVISSLATPRTKSSSSLANNFSLKKIIREMAQKKLARRHIDKHPKSVLLAIQNKPWTLSRRRNEIKKRNDSILQGRNQSQASDNSLEIDTQKKPEFVKLIEERTTMKKIYIDKQSGLGS